MKKVYNSIVVATYNGERYIKEQIDSIIENMGENDELIISDDGSTDKTIEIINNYMEKDDRIHFFNGPRLGIKQNFANGIKEAKGKYIFLSDQDDVWVKDKIKTIDKYFEDTNCNLILHNANIVDENLVKSGNTFFEFRNSKSGIIRNIYKNSYIGCCMAFKGELKEHILPIPNNIEMHDQWIGILAEKYGKVIFLNKCLIDYRRHGDNVSNMHHYPLKKMIKNRLIFIKELIFEKRRRQ